MHLSPVHVKKTGQEKHRDPWEDKQNSCLCFWGNGTCADRISMPRSLGFVSGSALSYKLNKVIINLGGSNKAVALES